MGPLQPAPVQSPAPRPTQNLLLRALGPDELNALRPDFSSVRLRTNQVLVQAGGVINFVCFPEAGVLSLHEISEETRTGVGIVGFEGAVGWPLLLGGERSPHEVVVAVGNADALCIRAEALIGVCRKVPALRDLVLRYVQSLICQMGHTISSNLHDRLERRLARWLLMNADRLHNRDIVLTHKQLGVMLGVRRATVTDALHVLEGAHLIRSVRGRTTICDRDALRRFAGASYGAPEEMYAGLISPFPSRAEVQLSRAPKSQRSVR